MGDKNGTLFSTGGYTDQYGYALQQMLTPQMHKQQAWMSNNPWSGSGGTPVGVGGYGVTSGGTNPYDFLQGTYGRSQHTY